MMYHLINEFHSSVFVTEMWSRWALTKFLNKDVHKPVKDSWSTEELLEEHVVLIGSLTVDVVEEGQAEVLVDGDVLLLVLQDLTLDLRVAHGCNDCVLDLPFLW